MHMTDILIMTLYGTAHCHLCEQAHRMAQAIADQYGYSLHTIDIADDDALMALYQTRIPVLSIRSTQALTPLRTIAWPFDEAQLLAWMQQSD